MFVPPVQVLQWEWQRAHNKAELSYLPSTHSQTPICKSYFSFTKKNIFKIPDLNVLNVFGSQVKQFAAELSEQVMQDGSHN